MKKNLFIVVFSLLSSSSWSQVTIIDSISKSLKEDYKVFIGFHNRNTFILSEKTKLFGLVGGLDFDNRVKLFAGIYGFGKANETQLIGRKDLLVDTAYRFTSTSNFSVGIEYDFYEQQRTSLSVPLQVGIGNVAYEYTVTDRTTSIRTNNYRVVPIETGVNAYYELLPWAGVRAGAGYRLNIGKKEVRRLSSPYYNLGLAILVGPLYQEIKKALSE